MFGGVFVFLLVVFSAVSAGYSADISEFKPNKIQKLWVERLDLGHWQTDKGLSEIIKLPTAPGNAAEDYAKLDSEYKKEKVSGTFRISPDSKGIQYIINGAKKAKCSLVPKFYPPMTQFTPKGPSVIAVRAYADAALKKAKKLESAGEYAAAEELYRSVIVMGWHLAEDRPNLLVYVLGLTVEHQAAKAYAKYCNRQVWSSQAKKLKSYEKFLEDTVIKVRVKSRVLISSWLDFASLAACREIVLKDKEPVWRQEAIISLGVMQNGFPQSSGAFTKNPFLQNVARETLKYAEKNDKVESIRQLAKWCINVMTEEKFMKIRQKNSRR
jgi:hypothetical protein